VLKPFLLLWIALFAGCNRPEEHTRKPDQAPLDASAVATPETDLRPADVFVEGDELSVEGFTFHKRSRKARFESYLGEVEYVVAKKGERVLVKFDADPYSPLNSADFGLFPFLGGKSQQVFISQDLPRGGCQWVVSVSPRFRIIFDGQALGAGREGYDLKALDLDNDGIYEIVAPITAFYQFQDKLYIGAIPLPDIIFKYDLAKQKYLPANPRFKERVFEELAKVPQIKNEELNFEHRSVALSNLLIHIYAGEEKQGWKAFEEDYKLQDKGEMERRVREILRDQPVYKLIYHR
jgi:hypothetical protein